MDLEPEIDHGPVMPAGMVILITICALVIGLLLNGPDILSTAQRQEAGWKRSLAIAAAEPFAAMSRALLLDRPHDLIDIAVGREEPSGPTTTTTLAVATPPTSISPVTSTTSAARRTITADQPLRLFIGGDSMVGQFGPMLQNEAEATGLIEVTEVVYEFDSGLTRTDYLDWPARLRLVTDSQDPEAMVLFFGGNDAQAIQIDGAWYDYGTSEWIAEYRQRVGDLMAELTADGRDVYWMGMPIVRSDSFREKVEVMNEIYSSEAEKNGVTFVDSWSVFTGPDGTYSEYLVNDDGDLVDMRLNDGIHLTTAGGIRLARRTLSEIEAAWLID